MSNIIILMIVSKCILLIKKLIKGNKDKILLESFLPLRVHSDQ